MDSQSCAFDGLVDDAPLSTPLPCPRRMVPQDLSPATSAHLLRKLLQTVVPMPLERAVAGVKRRRA